MIIKDRFNSQIISTETYGELEIITLDRTILNPTRKALAYIKLFK